MLAIFVTCLMWLSSSVTTPFNLPFEYRLALAFAIAAIGTSIDITPKLSFARASTTVNPIKPACASSFVSGGFYRFTRNPTYLGCSLQLLVWAAYLCNPLALVLVVVFVLYTTRFQIRPEERVLSERFGAEYVAYLKQVPRWVRGMAMHSSRKRFAVRFDSASLRSGSA
ncbi:MAG: isoprenylcysteine carboxylmethyltransferase family protein [Lysobacter sp.]|nr:isoprenylcysteine carboxylmethyltransferase family protein [Lysobacter sp.]